MSTENNSNLSKRLNALRAAEPNATLGANVKHTAQSNQSQTSKESVTIEQDEAYAQSVAVTGDSVGLLLKDLTVAEADQGQVLATSDSTMPLTKFKAQIYHLTKDEGGRTTPLYSGFRPKFAISTALVSGIITLPDGVHLCNSGDSIEADVELDSPIAIEKGLKFEIHDGSRIVSTGVVIEADSSDSQSNQMSDDGR